MWHPLSQIVFFMGRNFLIKETISRNSQIFRFTSKCSGWTTTNSNGSIATSSSITNSSPE